MIQNKFILLILISILITTINCQNCVARYCQTCNTTSDTCQQCYPNSKLVSTTKCECAEGYQQTGISSTTGITCEAKPQQDPLTVCMDELSTYANSASLKLLPTSKILNQIHIFKAILVGPTITNNLANCINAQNITFSSKLFQGSPYTKKNVTTTSYQNVTFNANSSTPYIEIAIQLTFAQFDSFKFEQDQCEANIVTDFNITTEVGVKSISTTYITTLHNGRVMYNSQNTATMGSFIVDPKFLQGNCVCTNYYTVPINVTLYLDEALTQQFLSGSSIGIGRQFFIKITAQNNKMMNIDNILQSNSSGKTNQLSYKVISSKLGQLVIQTKFIVPGNQMGVQLIVNFVVSRLLHSQNLRFLQTTSESPAEDQSGNYVSNLAITDGDGFQNATTTATTTPEIKKIYANAAIQIIALIIFLFAIII